METGGKVAVGMGVIGVLLAGTYLLYRKRPDLFTLAPVTKTTPPQPGGGIIPDYYGKPRQNATVGSLSGKISRAGDGYPLSGVAVTLGSMSATTDASGNYTFANIPFGKYTVQFSMKCYKPISQYLEFNADSPDIPLPLLMMPIDGDLWTKDVINGRNNPLWEVPLCDSTNGMKVAYVDVSGLLMCWPKNWSHIEVVADVKGQGAVRIYDSGEVRCAENFPWNDSAQRQVSAHIKEIGSRPMSDFDITKVSIRQLREGGFNNISLAVKYYTP